MNDDVITWAEILRKNGYFTSYVGKWHLNGSKSGWGAATNENDFGFTDRRYLFNRGHFKGIKMDSEGKKETCCDFMNGDTRQTLTEFLDDDKDNYLTDFLVDRTIDIIEEQRNKKEPFALMLSIPDPHSPDITRAPYSTQFDDLEFQIPKTMASVIENVTYSPAWIEISALEKQLNQKHLRQYLGMMAVVDENIGKLLTFLKNKGLEEDTIVVFTSDHGDLLFEHGRINKVLPYKTSATVPFIVRYPAKIKPGKIIHTAHSQVDFTPSILTLMGVENKDADGNEITRFHGEDTSNEWLNNEEVSISNRIIYMTDELRGRWAAAVTRRYKLVLSTLDSPWLFDQKHDPDELINEYENPKHFIKIEKMQKELMKRMEKFSDPMFAMYEQDIIIPSRAPTIAQDNKIPNVPKCFSCRDSRELIKTHNGVYLRCDSFKGQALETRKANLKRFCREDAFGYACSRTCGKCCFDSKGKIHIDGELKSCSHISRKRKKYCKEERVKEFCPAACNNCKTSYRGDGDCSDVSFPFLIEGDRKICADKSPDHCSLEHVNFLCPSSCDRCCTNSYAKVTLDGIGLKSCSYINESVERVTKYCILPKVQALCPALCESFIYEVSIE